MDIHVQLINAADTGDLEGVQQCLSNGADPLHWDSHALTRAASHNHIDVVRCLIPVSDVNADRAIALRTALANHNKPIVDLLWDKVDHALLMSAGTDTSLPFLVACEYGWYERAASVVHHPMHSFVVWGAFHALDLTTTDPHALQVWSKIIEASEPRHLLSLNFERALPSVQILKMMFHKFASDAFLSAKLIEKVADNDHLTHHIAQMYPLFKHLYPNFNDVLKIRVLSNTLHHNMLFAHEMIEHCRAVSVQFLHPDMVAKALRGDSAILNFCIQLWDSQLWSVSGANDTFRYEHILSTHAQTAPDKVLRVLHKHPQFVTPKVMHALLEHHDDCITTAVAGFMFGEDEESVYKISCASTWEYWKSFKSRIEKELLQSHVNECVPSALRKM